MCAQIADGAAAIVVGVTEILGSHRPRLRWNRILAGRLIPALVRARLGSHPSSSLELGDSLGHSPGR